MKNYKSQKILVFPFLLLLLQLLQLILTNQLLANEIIFEKIFENSEREIADPIIDSSSKKYSLDELLKMTKKRNYSVRTNAETVYQARKNIMVNMGRLLPRLNFGVGVDLFAAIKEGEYIDLVASLVGFLFPSNWFEWKESRLFYEAERNGYISLLANQINVTESLFYKVSLNNLLIELYDLYYQEMDRIIRTARVRADRGVDTRDLVLQLENLQFLVKNDLILVKNSQIQQLSDLAFAVGLPSEEWRNFKITRIPLPNLPEMKAIDPEEILPQVLQRSYELKELNYLVLAAQFSRKARMFEFLQPGGNLDAALGFGYVSYIQIGSSKIRQILIQIEQMKSNLKTVTYKTSSQFNTSLKLFETNYQGYENALRWYNLLQDKFELTGEYNAQDFVSAIESLFTFQSNLLAAQIQFLVAMAQVNRLLMQNEYYKNLKSLTPQGSNLLLSKEKGRENKRIEEAIKKGSLIIPES